MGHEFGIPVIFSPVAHPELNPIEEIWAYVKNIVLSRNGLADYQDEAGFNMRDVKKHVLHAMSQITAALWGHVEDDVIKREQAYLDLADQDTDRADSDGEQEFDEALTGYKHRVYNL
eukprot:m.51200 g.51200  ORF g.51200 m.51200 type:complete len:117 (+) comp6288_c0_seq1:1013-1363(+)